LDGFRGYPASEVTNTNNNGGVIANLLYCMEISNIPVNSGEEIFYNGYFTTPRVHGFSGGFNFTKIAEGGPNDRQPLAGCVFALESVEKSATGAPLWSASATSEANGAVRFSNIPSGHAYTLRETSIAAAYASSYAMSAKTYHVTVMYGDVVVTDPEKAPGEAGYIVFDSNLTNNDFRFANINTSSYIDINGTKTWVGDSDNYDGTRPASIQLQLLRDGTAIATATANAPNYTFSFPNLERFNGSGNPYTYKVVELAVSGYAASYSGEFDQNITNTLTSVAPTKFKVTFDYNDGETIPVIVEVEGGMVVKQPEDPTRGCFMFLGWRLDGEAFDFDTPITEDITLVAQWKEKTTPSVPITSLKIDSPAMTSVMRKSTVTFRVILNEGASDKCIIWSVSNESYATVDSHGTVTIFNNPGTVILSAQDPVSKISHSIILRIL
jgi:uncharacterized protein YjdB